MEKSADRKIGRYRILAKLGAGGMGVVYLARDENLGRNAALKFLPAEFSRDESRLRRFDQEARAVSALNHPNILTIYEIGSSEDGHFFATEYIEGETLRRRLQRSRPDATEALDIGIQVSTALAAAHAAGILHRDIKPENIMLRPDGYVKVLDFGLARPVATGSGMGEAATFAGSISTPGVVMGTVQYMSPEQARGLEVDARTDVFSLGVVLYEMVSGKQPFIGATTSDTLAAVLMREPLPLRDFAPAVPVDLQNIVVRAMAKDRDRRTRSARELLGELQSLRKRIEFDIRLASTEALPASGKVSATGEFAEVTESPPPGATASRPVPAARATPRRKTRGPVDSLAVLPLENTGSDPATEYLSDGVTESLIHRLAELPRLRVMARSAVIRYRGSKVDPRSAGSELGVRAVLAGRVLQMGENLVIRLELVDTGDGSFLWGETYRRKLADILEVEEEISGDILEKLRPKLGGAEKKAPVRRATGNNQAYQLYLQGRYHWNKRTGEGLRKSIEFYEQAIAIDPAFTQAYIGLAEASALLSWYAFGLVRPEHSMPRARTALLRAAEIDPSLAESHVTLGMVRLTYDWDWQGAEQSFLHAIELKPGYAMAHHWYPVLLTPAGRFDEALKQNEIALELEPMSLMFRSTRGWICQFAGRYDEAVGHFRNVLDVEPNFVTARWLLGSTYGAMGRYEQAVAQLEEARRLDRTPATLASLGYVHAHAGNAEGARAVLKELEGMALDRYVPPETRGLIHVGLGEHDLAIEHLQRAMEHRSSYCIFLKVDRRLSPLRGDPRFEALIRTAGIP